MQLVSLDQIHAARERIRPVARVTPVVDVSAAAGRPLWLKCESLQPGGAFKIRGAYNMVAQLTSEQRSRGVITVSWWVSGRPLWQARTRRPKAG